MAGRSGLRAKVDQVYRGNAHLRLRLTGALPFATIRPLYLWDIAFWRGICPLAETGVFSWALPIDFTQVAHVALDKKECDA